MYIKLKSRIFQSCMDRKRFLYIWNKLLLSSKSAVKFFLRIPASLVKWFKIGTSFSCGQSVALHFVRLRPIYTGDFCRGNSMQFVSGLSCNFKMARGNQVRFSVRFVAAISQGFRTCLKLDATLARQKLHGVAATKIARVNWPLGSTKVVLRNVRLCELQPSILIGPIIMQIVWICDKKMYSAITLFLFHI